MNVLLGAPGAMRLRDSTLLYLAVFVFHFEEPLVLLYDVIFRRTTLYQLLPFPSQL